jgi:filamentous hemagglutinin family protein
MSKPCPCNLHTLALAAVLLCQGVVYAQSPPAPTQLPQGGKVVGGSAAISSSGSTLTVQQSSQRAAIDWNTFNVGSGAQVNFNQPNAAAVTLNRVLDNNPSHIMGRINAPGQVFIVNPNGVLFGATSQVDVGGLLVTTHGISNADFMAGKSTFEGNGKSGSIVNLGSLQASLGGYIALLAPQVRNEGVIIAREGTIAMAAGNKTTLVFSGQSLTALQIDEGVMDALVDNKHLVRSRRRFGGDDRAQRQCVVGQPGEKQRHGASADHCQQGGPHHADGRHDFRHHRGQRHLGRQRPQWRRRWLHRNLGRQGEDCRRGAHHHLGRATAKPVTGWWTPAASPWPPAVATSLARPCQRSWPPTMWSCKAQPAYLRALQLGNVTINDYVHWEHQHHLDADSFQRCQRQFTNGCHRAMHCGAGHPAQHRAHRRWHYTYRQRHGHFQPPLGQVHHLVGQQPHAVDRWAKLHRDQQFGVLRRNHLRHACRGWKATWRASMPWAADIDASATATWGSGAGFRPIASGAQGFSGTFQGLGHSITGLTVNPSGLTSVGMFSQNLLRRQHFQRGAGRRHHSSSANATNIGGLVGLNEGRINKSFNSGHGEREQ